MKVAVQLFGHLRTYNKCYKYLKRFLLDKYDCDVFMHTWSTIEHSTKTHHDNKMLINSSAYKEEDFLIKNITRFSENLLIEEQYPQDLGDIITLHNMHISIFGIKSMFYSMGKANKLREDYERKHNITYDYIIFIRPDILLKKFFDINHFLCGLSSEEIKKGFFTTSCPFFGIHNNIKNVGLTDVLFWGKPSVMSDIFSNQSEITKDISNGIKINGPETFLMNFVEKKGYKIYLINYYKYCDFEILRSVNFKNIRKKLIRLRVRNRTVSLYFMQIWITQILRIKFTVLGKWTIDICIGSLNDKLK